MSNLNLFKPWVYRAIPKNLINGLNGFFPSKLSYEGVHSLHNPAIDAKIRENFVSAFAKVAVIGINKANPHVNYGGFGPFQNGTEVGVSVEITEGTERHLAVVKNDKVYVSKEQGAYVFREGYENGVALIAAAIVYELSYPVDNEFKHHTSEAIKLMKDGISEKNIEEFGKHMAVLSENFYRRYCGAKPRLKLLNDVGNIFALTNLAISSNKYVPSTVTGKMNVFTVSDKTNSVSSGDVKDMYKVNRVWSPEEERLIPKLPEWYVMPKEVPEICELINGSTGTFTPKRNFMLRGPSSTGKTSMARAIASLLGMPYMFLTCSSDTESSAFLGEPMYDKNGNVKYIESNFIKAIKNGYVIEVQEPYVIAKQGVLTALNGLMDDSAGVTLPTGEFIQRHPDCVVIFTTNVSYVGCKKPNQSVLRRMNNVYDIDLPSSEEICKRVIANTKFSDKSLLKNMVACMEKIRDHLEKEMIDDGVCGVSELIDWVSTLQIGKDIIAAAKTTVISKATDDIAEQAKICAMVEAMFVNTQYVDATNVVDAALKR